jgi:hypothetical protein
MYNLVISANQNFSTSAENVLPYQEWSFSPAPTHEFASFIGQGAPPNLDVATKIKNYISSLGILTYDQFYVKAVVVFEAPNNAIPWFTLTGPIAAATGDGYLLSQTNLNVNTGFSFTNMALLLAGTYVARVYFNVSGKLPSGGLVHLETISYALRMQRLPYNGLLTVPSQIEFVHQIGEALPTPKTLSIYANVGYVLYVQDHISLSGGDLTLISDIGGVKTYQGFVTQTVNVLLDPSIETLGPTEPDYVGQIELHGGLPAPIGDVTSVRVYQYDEEQDYTVNPQSLQFFAVKGVQEAPSQPLDLFGYGSYTLTKPSWLTINSTSGTNNGSLIVKPIVSANLTPGTYSGVIKITTSSGLLEVYVQYTVIEKISLGIKADAVNFTKDHGTISTFWGNNTEKVKIDITSILFSYKFIFQSSKSGTFLKGIFNNFAKFNLGEIVHQMMPTLDSLKQIDFNTINAFSGSSGGNYGGQLVRYYNPSINTIKINYALTGSIIAYAPVVFSNCQFIKGRRPSRFTDTYGIIDYNTSAVRVTKNSQAILNVYQNRKFTTIQLYRNGVSVAIFSPKAGVNKLFGLRLNFSEFSPGDVIEARVLKSAFSSEEEGKDYFSQKYIMFPDTVQGYHIAWENEHGLAELLEFTGDFTFATDRNEITSLTYQNFVQKLKKHDSVKEPKFIANT